MCLYFYIKMCLYFYIKLEENAGSVGSPADTQASSEVLMVFWVSALRTDLVNFLFLSVFRRRLSGDVVSLTALRAVVWGLVPLPPPSRRFGWDYHVLLVIQRDSAFRADFVNPFSPVFGMALWAMFSLWPPFGLSSAGLNYGKHLTQNRFVIFYSFILLFAAAACPAVLLCVHLFSLPLPFGRVITNQDWNSVA